MNNGRSVCSLGRLPPPWKAIRLKYAARYRVSNVDKIPAEGELPVRLCNYTDVYYHDHITPDLELMRTTATADEIKRFGLRSGDLILTKDSEEWTDIAVPALVVESEPDMVCGYHLAIVRPEPAQLDSSFLLRVLQSEAVNYQFQIAATGVTRYGLPANAIGTALLPLPPLQEQRVLAAHLDRETEKIDALVAKKERLIELLEEKRSALISHVVTRGLDPTVPMKDSGVGWLGQVPQDWTLKRLKFLIEEALMYGASEVGDICEPDYPRFVRITDVKDNGDLRPETFRSLPPDVAAPFQLAEGDVLLARSGATVGKSFRYRVSWGSCCFAGYLIRARVRRRRLMPEFLDYFTRTSNYWDWVRTYNIQATIQNLSAEKYANLVLAVPELSVQKQIVVHLDRETARIDTLVGKVREAIDKLKEYRAALITAAVTGKIDVRDDPE